MAFESDMILKGNRRIQIARNVGVLNAEGVCAYTRDERDFEETLRDEIASCEEGIVYETWCFLSDEEFFMGARMAVALPDAVIRARARDTRVSLQDARNQRAHALTTCDDFVNLAEALEVGLESAAEGLRAIGLKVVVLPVEQEARYA